MRARQMTANPSKILFVAGMSFLFAALGAAFLLDPWGHPIPLAAVPPVDPTYTNTATVRQSAAELFRTEGDTSGLSCYACHDAKKPVVVHLDTNNNPVLPPEHKDLVLRHGRNDRNNHCFNCHNPTNLEQLQLRTPGAPPLKLTESSRLCGGCHGPTYRDWELGVHGRVSGYWNRELGAAARQDCTSCHDPHNPAFPSMKPGPAPQPRQFQNAGAQEKGH